VEIAEESLRQLYPYLRKSEMRANKCEKMVKSPPAAKSQVQVQIVCQEPTRKYLERPNAKPQESEKQL